MGIGDPCREKYGKHYVGCIGIDLFFLGCDGMGSSYWLTYFFLILGIYQAILKLIQWQLVIHVGKSMVNVIWVVLGLIYSFKDVMEWDQSDYDILKIEFFKSGMWWNGIK